MGLRALVEKDLLDLENLHRPGLRLLKARFVDSRDSRLLTLEVRFQIETQDKRECMDVNVGGARD